MSHESRIISSAFSDTIADQQSQIRKKHQAILNQIKAKDTEDSNHLHTNPDKIKRAPNMAQAQSSGINQFYKPIFKWEQDTNKETFHIIPSEKSITYKSAYNLESGSSHLLSLFGYKIDITQQVDQYKQKLQKFFIESKSHNALIGKFSELKFGLVAGLLSLLGVEPTTIDTLKKEALKRDIEDNIENFYKNDYNIELLTIFKKNRKDSGREKVLKKLRSQLIKQMKLYGQDTFYIKSKIYEIKKDQVNKIFTDLLEEKQNLMYIRNFQ
ncbi:MAG: hypothetical protein VW397_01585 [Candidatus Margulisiibacteriota bacterium]